jgi:hypothetical protein
LSDIQKDVVHYVEWYYKNLPVTLPRRLSELCQQQNWQGVVRLSEAARKFKGYADGEVRFNAEHSCAYFGVMVRRELYNHAGAVPRVRQAYMTLFRSQNFTGKYMF